MRVTALGHAGLKIETASATLLLDPWFSPEGAFQGSWFQFPDNSHLLDDASLFEPTAIAISHEHLDHVDPWFLRRVPEHVPVVVPNYPSPVLRHKIEQGGPRRIIEAPQWESVEIASDVSVFFVSEPPMNHDSAIIIQADGKTVLNLNDARLFPLQFREIKQKVGGEIDVFSFQGAGASWYPMCYEYDAEHSAQQSRQKRVAKFAYCFRAMRAVNPVVGLPFAGPPAFLDPDLIKHNAEMDHGIFPDQDQVSEWLQSRGISNTEVLLPGDAWDVDARSKCAGPHFRDFSFRSRETYIQEYSERRRPYLDTVLSRYPDPSDSLWPLFESYFSNLLELSPYFNLRVGMRVGFDITGPGGGKWSVDFQSGRVHRDLEHCGYVYRFASRWLPPILNGATPWEDFFLSLRFSAKREPDVYNDHLLGLLKFADRDALAEVERFENTLRSDERIELHAEGVSYSVQRYCPHAGNDLLNTGEVLPGAVLRCLAHHYEFDLKTGRCLNGNCALEVEQIGPETTDPGTSN